jgi:hypothetical protein
MPMTNHVFDLDGGIHQLQTGDWSPSDVEEFLRDAPGLDPNRTELRITSQRFLTDAELATWLA